MFLQAQVRISPNSPKHIISHSMKLDTQTKKTQNIFPTFFYLIRMLLNRVNGNARIISHRPFNSEFECIKSNFNQ